MRRIMITILGVGMLASLCTAGRAEEPQLKDNRARDSYSIGYEFGESIRKQEVDADDEILLQALRDALAGRKALLSAEEMKDSLMRVRRTVKIATERRAHELAVKNRDEGKAFLSANGKKEGIVTLPSGLQYRVLREGDGPTPGPADLVRIQYRGTFISGVEFDNTAKRTEPTVVKVEGMIKGWQEALQLMKSGSKWQLFVPSELAYGERALGRIQANSTLLFELELVGIETDLVRRAMESARQFPDKAGDDNHAAAAPPQGE